MSAPCPPTQQSVPQTTRRSSSRSLKLGNCFEITLTIDEITQLSVPAMSFAENIDRLNQMWDISVPEGRLCRRTHSIALIYWPDIFNKTGLWSAYKSQFLVERYRQGTPERFWEAFGTVDEGKISYTAICTSLRHERKRLGEAIAAQPRAEYGGDFESKFSYRCSRRNDVVVMTKASAIAKQYKLLQSV
ncbi:hypothetical protein B0H13DRAFT_1632850 [Mycena leptocephala]|nr:hypothetical protein B0H13DRAFT_1632850 [Mycena leptocephala]